MIDILNRPLTNGNLIITPQLERAVYYNGTAYILNNTSKKLRRARPYRVYKLDLLNSDEQQIQKQILDIILEKENEKKNSLQHRKQLARIKSKDLIRGAFYITATGNLVCYLGKGVVGISGTTKGTQFINSIKQGYIYVTIAKKCLNNKSEIIDLTKKWFYNEQIAPSLNIVSTNIEFTESYIQPFFWSIYKNKFVNVTQVRKQLLYMYQLPRLNIADKQFSWTMNYKQYNINYEFLME